LANLANRGPAVKRSLACQSIAGGYTAHAMEASGKTPPGSDAPAEDRPEPLYFFPDREVTDAELRQILEGDDLEERAWAISHLLRYAQWEDIWTYVSREEVRDIFPSLELPENLRQAWGRMLKVEAPVG